MQLIKYNWIGWEPFLITREGDAQFRLKLFEQSFHISLGEKTCTGFLKDGMSFACPEKRKLDYGSKCNFCKLEDSFFMCMPCTGEKCINQKRREECRSESYYIYLAAFDSLLKVGISFESRVLTRLVEQGADFGATIGYMQDGKDVREAEQKVKEHLQITDRLRGEEKHSVLFGSPNKAAASIARALKLLKGFDWLIKPEIYDLRKYYRLENVFSQPRFVFLGKNTDISGSVAAAKGNLIVFKTDSGFFSLNAHDMMGRELTFLDNGNK